MNPPADDDDGQQLRRRRRVVAIVSREFQQPNEVIAQRIGIVERLERPRMFRDARQAER